jgi:hypothetical protein
MEDATGFNDQLPMEQFENSRSFYSLRASSLAAEMAWLDQSDQPGWSWDDDPTDNDVISGVEQTFCNPQNEIVICNVIYKYVDGGILHIPMDHAFASEILDAANNGMSMADLVQEFGGVNSEQTKDQIAGELFAQSFPLNTAVCIYNINETKDFLHPNTNKKYVKGKHKIRSGPFNKVYKAVTNSFKHKRGKWRKRRTTISAGLEGFIHDPQIGCGTKIPIDQRTTRKKRKRREESHRVPRAVIIPSDIGVNNEELKSTHYQDGHVNYYLIEN